MSTAVTSPSSATNEPRGFRRLWRVLRQLFHEVIGALFAVLALFWLNSALRAWSRDVAHWLIALVVVVGLIFVAFAFTAFRRARKL
jgi:glycerol uptake facilitator-like aquaporin